MFKVFDVVLLFLLLISNVSFVDFEHVYVSWVKKFRRPSLYFLLPLFQILSTPSFPCRLQPPPPFLFQLSCFFRLMGDRATFGVAFYVMILWMYTCGALGP